MSDSRYVELYIDQGSDFSTTIIIQDDITNLSQNLDSYVVTSSMRRSLLSQNTSGTINCSISDSANGVMELSMDAANTANLHIGTHMFDVRVNVSGSISRLIEGIVVVTPSITKS